MSASRLRAAALLLAGSLGLAACNEGYGYSSMSVGYGAPGYCDPRWNDCNYGGYSAYGPYGGYDAYGYGYGYDGAYDPWWGWYGDYYYPGIGFYVYDQGGGRHRWDDRTRRYWEGRRHAYGGRDWNDSRWQRWDGYRDRNWNSGSRGDWNRGDGNWNRGDGSSDRRNRDWYRNDGSSNRGNWNRGNWNRDNWNRGNSNRGGSGMNGTSTAPSGVSRWSEPS